MPALPSNSPTVTPSLQRTNGTLVEIKSLLEELTLVFQGTEDINSVKVLAESIEKARHAANAQIADLQTELQKCKTRLDEAKQNATPIEDEGAHQMRIHQLEYEKQQIIHDIMQLEEECVSSKHALDEINLKVMEYKSEYNTLSSDSFAQIERSKREISLYASISHFKIDFDAPPNMIRGFVADANTQEVHPFEYTTGNQSDFEMINQLWSVIGGYSA